MKEFMYENQGINTYLVYAVNQEDNIDTMSLGMLTNNQIPGLAPAIFTQMDSDMFIKYNVSAHISVKQFFMGAVNKKRLIGVFNGILDAMISADDYMIDVNTILLDLDYIFADVTTCDTVLICLPLMNENAEATNLSAFFKNIMFNTQFDQTENCDHVAKIMNYLNSNPIFSLHDFKALLETIQTGNAPVAAVAPVAVPASQPQAQQAPIQKAPVQQTPVQQPPVQQTPVQQPRAAQPQKAPQQNRPASVPQQAQNKPAQQFNTPPAQAAKPAQAQQPADADGKKMTMFNLLMHYNKENAALYKAQKQATKASSATATPPVQHPKQKGAAPAANPGFAIPGQQPQMAVPGQQPQMAVPGQQPQMAVPGQQPQRPQPVQQPQCPPVQQSQKPAAPVAAAPQQPAYHPAPQASAQPSRPLSFGETTVLGGGSIGETTVLGGGALVQNQMDPHLIRTKNNEKIPLNKPVFRIGKERSYVDYFIGDNTAISRSHANIVNHDGEFYVVDTNSTNHTYVNGGMIASNVETKLSHGTKIRLANEDFEFKMY